MEQSVAEPIEQQVKSWLDDIVIGLNLCPFAKRPRRGDQIQISVSAAESLESLMTCLMEQCFELENSSADKLETTLVVVPRFLQNFNDYLDALYLAEQLIQENRWKGIFQIASFHPEYQFQGTEKEDPENLTNRSPYPIFHLLREQSLEYAIEAYENAGDSTEHIPQNNRETIQALSVSARRSLFGYLYR